MIWSSYHHPLISSIIISLYDHYMNIYIWYVHYMIFSLTIPLYDHYIDIWSLYRYIIIWSIITLYDYMIIIWYFLSLYDYCMIIISLYDLFYPEHLAVRSTRGIYLLNMGQVCFWINQAHHCLILLFTKLCLDMAHRPQVVYSTCNSGICHQSM